jgi:preprotein translocase subunit SecA
LNTQNISGWSRIGRKVDRLRGRKIEYDLKPYERILDEINFKEKELGLKTAGDALIKQRSMDLGESARAGRSPDDLLPEAFAIAREASARALGMRHFDVQVIAGIALHQGCLVEMLTGEGKTLAAVLPGYLNALGGLGVHVLTFNNYLAARDAEWMGPAYGLLGLKVGAVVEGMAPSARRRAYLADVTYLTAKESGYDFLRESLAREQGDMILRPKNFAIVDEADSILIDEARVPLVIAGSGGPGVDRERDALAKTVKKLFKNVHYTTDENSRNVFLTDKGVVEVEDMLGLGSLHQADNRDLLTRLNQALHAEALLKRDVDYIVRGGQIEIVDEFTGRVVMDRHWPDGLHRAVEAKECLVQKDQGYILNSITMQHFLSFYPKLSGMTGTAVPADREIDEFYDLKTVVIPPNRPCIRMDHPDVLFSNLEAKRRAIVEEVKSANARGQPVLIGTCSVEESENLAARLREVGIECNVLNASNDHLEAEIVREAGAPGAVTVSTNMAGRGTDIRLGGADEKDRGRVVKSGGLYVIGTNRHESRRIDNQLKGRAGRQGDPGSSRFFVSLEDDLIKRFGVQDLIPKPYLPKRDFAPVTHPYVHRKLSHIQRVIEGENLDIRRTLWRYSSLVEKQRRLFHSMREKTLKGAGPSLLAEISPVRYRVLLDDFGPDILGKVEKVIALYHFDRAWTEYLAGIADMREGIYLNVVGGRDPLGEFVREADDLFERIKRDINNRMKETFEKAQIDSNGIDADKEGLRGPSSTWTYLVNDNPFDWLSSVSSMGNIGFGALAGFTVALHSGIIIPVLIVKAVWKKLHKKRQASNNRENE